MDDILKCKKCNTDAYVKIIDSRKKYGTKIRYRQCMKCKRKWKTIEIDYWEYVQKVKDHAEFL